MIIDKKITEVIREASFALAQCYEKTSEPILCPIISRTGEHPDCMVMVVDLAKTGDSLGLLTKVIHLVLMVDKHKSHEREQLELVAQMIIKKEAKNEH